jgi:hypothetical protein
MSTSAIDEVLPPSAEACDWGTDPDSGSVVVRLTNAPGWSHNIYCEQPYTGPDGRYVLVGRTYDLMSGHYQLLAADLKTLTLKMIERDLPCEFVAHHAYSEWAYYTTFEGEVRRVSLLTLERQSVLPAGTSKPYPQRSLETASADNQWLIGYEPGGKGMFRSIAMNTGTGKTHVFLDDPNNRNPHLQADTAGGTRVMQQLLAGERVAVVVTDLNGGEITELPIGGKHTAESSGHMAWIADTGRVACAVGWDREKRRQDPRHPQGNLVIAGPGDKTPRVIGAPDHAYYHVSVSRCGKYFVCDDFMVYHADAFNVGHPGVVRIVVGSIVTGKARVLLRDCQSYGLAGTSRFEPTPYFTADNKHVIYNGSPLGLNQVFAARVPEGLLESLD